jgi:hypothetical protein
VLPGAEHVIACHLLVEGSAFAQLENDRPVSLSAGDIVVFPHGDPHRMGKGSASQFLDHAVMLNFIRWRHLEPMQAGGGEISRFVCG